MFSFDSVLCHFLTCSVLSFIAMSKHSLVSWLFYGMFKKFFLMENLFCQYVL